MRTLKNLGYILLVMIVVKLAMTIIGVAERVALEPSPAVQHSVQPITQPITLANVDEVVVHDEDGRTFTVASHCEWVGSLAGFAADVRDKQIPLEEAVDYVNGLKDLASASSRKGFADVVRTIYASDISIASAEKIAQQTCRENAMKYANQNGGRL